MFFNFEKKKKQWVWKNDSSMKEKQVHTTDKEELCYKKEADPC